MFGKLLINKADKIQRRAMTNQTIDMLDRGVDIVTVQKMMGHADPKTTSRYDRRPERTKQDAANKLHFPYTKKDLD